MGVCFVYGLPQSALLSGSDLYKAMISIGIKREFCVNIALIALFRLRNHQVKSRWIGQFELVVNLMFLGSKS